ncbi:MAG: hypothetical protein IAE84_02660 [Saprospiraceae bacterium]|jgi:hypothetical protein|nr:hypothetical protein [Saprospiraceae bacterium]HRD81092.1 hypothetical protein [Saprospiraceae bacterium]HRF39851.1 hypothetical protein [Saprospiraceae bacterium]HRJ16876.1 hypothetical protein [Saprospiraceae bacterium]HRK79992.1 hypothetical protein [Saprospiraceae bacterium]
MMDTDQGYDIAHRRHINWLLQLDYMQDQVRIFQNELSRVIHQHPDFMSVIEHVGEYRAILLKKLHHIDEYRSKIALLERALKNGVWDTPPIKEELLEESLSAFFTEFDTLKITLRRFVSRND